MEDGEEQKIIFRLGSGKDSNEASSIAKKFRGTAADAAALNTVKKFWNGTIGALQVESPDAANHIITNGWLTYQTLSSRPWGLSGFYQSGDAFGFRDQLQELILLLHARPELAREQILLCASRQFKEGDVQHWWHPLVGQMLNFGEESYFDLPEDLGVRAILYNHRVRQLNMD